MKINFEGMEEIEKRLGEIEDRMNNATGLLQGFMNDLSGSIEQTFNAQGSPDAWPPRKTGGSWPVLDKTGRLRDSAASMQDGGDSIARVSPQQIEMGTTVEYGKYHQHPEEYASLDRGIMPVRRFLMFFQEQLDAWHERARRFFWWGEL